MITETTYEHRLAALEQAVAELQKQISNGHPKDWLDRVTGSVSDEDAFQKALEYGRIFRDADRPADDIGETP